MRMLALVAGQVSELSFRHAEWMFRAFLLAVNSISDLLSHAAFGAQRASMKPLIIFSRERAGACGIRSDYC